MGRDDGYWSVLFPDLFHGGYVDYAASHVSFTTGAVPDALVSRLHVVAVTADAEVLVCRSVQGWRFLPGGTREPGESLVDLAGRELAEEAGTRLAGHLRLFGAQIADSTRLAPFRLHLPHPRAYWAYAVGCAEVIGPPSNPPDGEQVVEVSTLTPSRAVSFLAEDDPVHADVLRLADVMGLIRSSS